jgi:hypothetical protein
MRPENTEAADRTLPSAVSCCPGPISKLAVDMMLRRQRKREREANE